jgi:hypothetical protein
MPRNPVQLSLRKENLRHCKAVPRDRAHERNDVLEKIVAGELNIWLERHISHIVKCLGSDMP